MLSLIRESIPRNQLIWRVSRTSCKLSHLLGGPEGVGGGGGSPYYSLALLHIVVCATFPAATPRLLPWSNKPAAHVALVKSACLAYTTINSEACCAHRKLVRIRWKESAGRVSREEAAARIAELIGHAMTHCRLQGDGYSRDDLLTSIMEVYREMGCAPSQATPCCILKDLPAQ